MFVRTGAGGISHEAVTENEGAPRAPLSIPSPFRLQTPAEAESAVPAHIFQREPLPIPSAGAFEHEHRWPAPLPPPAFRAERLVLASDFAAELAARGLEVDGVHELPSGSYVLELVPAEPEEPCTS